MLYAQLGPRCFDFARKFGPRSAGGMASILLYCNWPLGNCRVICASNAQSAQNHAAWENGQGKSKRSPPLHPRSLLVIFVMR